MTESRPYVMYAVTASVTARAFLVGQLAAVGEHARVALVVGDELPIDLLMSEGVRGFALELTRQPSPLKDLRGLVRLVRLVRQEKPDAVIFGTPKMGLLAALATWLVRTPRRIYVLHGVRWEGESGVSQFILRSLERLTCSLATEVVAVSESVRRVAIERMAVAPAKARLIHHGSANGIDSSRFAPLGALRSEVRRSLGVPVEAVIYTFAGRLTRDKGIQQLAQVWRGINAQVPTAHLVVVGQREPVDSVDEAAIASLEQMTSVSLLGASDRIEEILGAADVNISLSRREGMPTVILEAASCEVPTVGYAVTGVADAVTAQTGILVPLDSTHRVVAAAVLLGTDRAVRNAMGEQARSRVVADFQPDALWAAWVSYLAVRPTHYEAGRTR